VFVTADVTDLEAFIIPLKIVCVRVVKTHWIFSVVFLPFRLCDFRAVRVRFVMERTSKTKAVPSHHNGVRYRSILIVLSVSQKPNKSSCHGTSWIRAVCSKTSTDFDEPGEAVLSCC